MGNSSDALGRGFRFIVIRFPNKIKLHYIWLNVLRDDSKILADILSYGIVN